MQPGHPSMCAQHLGHAEAVAGATVVRNADCASRVWSSARKNKLQITIFVKSNRCFFFYKIFSRQLKYFLVSLIMLQD